VASLPDGVKWSYQQKEDGVGTWFFQGTEHRGKKNGILK
jgi:hypothetical protein